MAFSFPKSVVIGEYGINPQAPKGSHDEKFPPLATLYPERDRYLTVEPSRYYSQEFADREWRSMWRHAWTCAGRASDVSRIGAWFKYDLGRESFIIVRSSATQIRAFYNVCRHRGNRLVIDDFGQTERFVCSFHGWQFRPDGRVAEIVDRPTFRSEALCGGLNLVEVRCETWAGFVFINMDSRAEPLEDYLGDIVKLMEPYRMGDMHVVKDVVIPFKANWKIAYEAFIESYHLQQTHPQAVPFVDDVAYQLDIFRNGHGRLHTSLAIPSPRVSDRNTTGIVTDLMLAEVGLEPEKFMGRAMDVRGAIVAAKRKPDNSFGIDYSQFSDSQCVDDWNYSLFPNMTFNTHPEGVLIMRFLPHAEDPGRSYYHLTVITRKLKPGMRPPAYMGVEPEVDVSGATRPTRRYTSMERPELGEVLEQDIRNIEGVQAGLRSESFNFNKYGEQEQRIMQTHAEIDRYFARFP
jgi:phenylpropionate dioxygenase-like ring-hydroxylating dioxygenase large terminal subunit